MLSFIHPFIHIEVFVRSSLAIRKPNTNRRVQIKLYIPTKLSIFHVLFTSPFFIFYSSYIFSDIGVYYFIFYSKLNNFS